MKLEAQEIMDMQNQIALKEFETNYNQPEYVRCLNDMNNELEYVKLAKELEDKLQRLILKPYEVKVSANSGTISIYKRLDEHTLKSVKDIFATIKLPYSYVMGGKVGKKVMQQIVEQYS